MFSIFSEVRLFALFVIATLAVLMIAADAEACVGHGAQRRADRRASFVAVAAVPCQPQFVAPAPQFPAPQPMPQVAPPATKKVRTTTTVTETEVPVAQRITYSATPSVQYAPAYSVGVRTFAARSAAPSHHAAAPIRGFLVRVSGGATVTGGCPGGNCPAR